MNFESILDDTYQQLNQVRLRPRQTADKIRQLQSAYQGRLFKNKFYTRQGITALEDLIQNLSKRQPSYYRLKWSFALHMAADQQANFLGKNGLFKAQNSPIHQNLQERVKKYAIVKGKISQIYQFGGKSSEQILQDLLIDDGLASRKRRQTLLNPIFRYVGIGSSYHQTNQYCTVIILAEEIVSLVAPDSFGSFKRRDIIVGQKKVISQEKNFKVINPFLQNSQPQVVIQPLRNQSNQNSMSKQTSLTDHDSPEPNRFTTKNNSQFILQQQSLSAQTSKPEANMTPLRLSSNSVNQKGQGQIQKPAMNSRQPSIFTDQIIPKFNPSWQSSRISEVQQPKYNPKPVLIQKKEGSVIIYEPNPNSSQYFNNSLIRSGAPESESLVYKTYNPDSRSQANSSLDSSNAYQFNKSNISQQNKYSFYKDKKEPQIIKQSKNEASTLPTIPDKKQSKCLIM